MTNNMTDTTPGAVNAGDMMTAVLCQPIRNDKYEAFVAAFNEIPKKLRMHVVECVQEQCDDMLKKHAAIK